MRFLQGSALAVVSSLALGGLSSLLGADDEPQILHEPVAGRSVVIEPLAAQTMPRVLVFFKTAGFEHRSIPDALDAIDGLGDASGFAVDRSDDGADFTDANLADYDAVVFVSTTGDFLTDEQQGAFERYIQGGGGFAGIHAATDAEYGWDWYGELVGSWFQTHPPGLHEATIDVEDPNHISTEHLGDTWVRTDEWYDFRTNPRNDVNVLLTLDETTYTGGGMGADHPIAWYHEFDGGRAWYTAGGHTSESYAEPDFLQHLAGGIEYAIGVEPDDPAPPTTTPTPSTTSPSTEPPATPLLSIDEPAGPPTLGFEPAVRFDEDPSVTGG